MLMWMALLQLYKVVLFLSLFAVQCYGAECTTDYNIITINANTCDNSTSTCLHSNGSLPCCSLDSVFQSGQVPHCSRLVVDADSETIQQLQTRGVAVERANSCRIATVLCSSGMHVSYTNCDLNSFVAHTQFTTCSETFRETSLSVQFDETESTSRDKDGDDDDDCDINYFSLKGERKHDIHLSNVCFYEKRNTTCVQEGYWFGNISSDGYDAFPCPFGYCSFNNCSSCGEKHFYCEIFEDDFNSLCYGNRGGVLCSQCKDNYTFTFNAIDCAPNESCSYWHILTFIVLILIFWVGLVTVLLVVVSLDLHIGSGQLYCFIFYFSVLQFYIGGSFPTEFLFIVELLITGFIQLDPKIFGLIPICVPWKFYNMEYAALRYANPVFLSVVIGLLVMCSRYITIPLFHKSSRGINAICILLYLSFFSLTQTSLSFLVPVSLGNLTYANIDPTVPYFHGWHIVFTVVAALVQVVLVIPFLCLLLFSPYLGRWFNLIRLKPILDEFQACYKEDYRYFVGMYMTCRMVIFFICCIGIYFVNIYLLQVMAIFLLLALAILQPYKDRWLNILDSLLVTNLILLSILHGSTANVVFESSSLSIVRNIIVHMLVLLPLVYFFSLCLRPLAKHVYTLLLLKCRKKKTRRLLTVNEEGVSNEREPLLFQQSIQSVKSSSSRRSTDTRKTVQNSKPTTTIVGVM